MGLKGKLIYETEIKCHGDVFHELFSSKPHHTPNVAPGHIQGCAAHEGEFGTHGSILNWDYTIDGKKEVMKSLIDIDEEQKSVTAKALEGSTVLETCKSYKITVHVDTNGDDHVVTWTIEYVKFDEDKDDAELFKYVNWCINITKEIEAHHANDQ